jgi:hypothetical protein
MAKERKAKKLRRQPKLKNYYAAQFMRTETNRKRRMRNHIRSHPLDKKAVKTYEFVKNFGYATFELNSKGRKRQERADARAAMAVLAEGAS